MIRRWAAQGWLALALLLAARAGLAAAPGAEQSLPPLPLTASQKALLAAHPVLRLGVEKDWAPIEFIDQDGRYGGVISSYMRALEVQLGIRFEIVRKDTFGEVLAAFDRNEIDVLSALTPTDERRASMVFTEPYIVFTDGIIVRSDEPYVEKMEDFALGRRLAVVDGYGSNTRAAANHPQLVVVPVRTTEEALFAVSTGRADIAIAALAAAYQLTQNRGLTNLRMAANYEEFEQSMAIAVRPELASLVPLFDSAIEAIPPATRDAMRAQWTRVQIDRGVARSTVVFWTVTGLLALVAMAGWVLWLLSQQKRRSELLLRAEEAETQSRAMIEAMPAVFWRLQLDTGRPATFNFYGNRAQELVGIKPGQMSARFDDVLLHMSVEDRQRLQVLMDRHGKSLTSFRFEHCRFDPKGRPQGWSYVQAVPRREKGGMVWHGCTIDISERKQLEEALEQSRSQLEALAAGVPGALWQFRREADGQQRYTYMSDGIVYITGRTPAETNQLMMDKSFVSVHPDDLHVLQTLMERLTRKQGIEEARYRLRTVDGGWKWVQVAARAMPIGPDGAVVWNGITLDATRLHETEEALREQRLRLSEVTDSISGALWRLRRKPDGSGVYFDFFSEGIQKVTGRSAAEMTDPARDAFRDVSEADRERIDALLKQAVATGEPVETEYTVLDTQGQPVRLFARAAVRLEQGEPVWTGVLLNVSERHRLTQQLDEARTRLADIAAHFPGAIFQIVRSPEGRNRFTYVSQGITLLTGRPPRTRDGRESLHNLENIHAEDRANVSRHFEQAVQSSRGTQFDYRLVDSQGKLHWVHCALTSRQQADGSALINGLLLDAEDAKRMEADLRTATQQAEAASHAKSRFLASMSHEIRTPMNAVIGLAHIAMTSETNPVQAERIGKIHRAGKALLKLLNDILEYSRLDAGKFTPVLAPFDLHEMNEALRLFCAPAAETKGLQLLIECAEGVPLHWLGDATRIQQVLLNLLTNAIKFTDSGQVRLLVQTLAGHSGLRFTVQDSGIGMNAEEVLRVFEAFEQANGEIERRHGGSVVGFSISRDLVVALGGRISVESTPGQGTRFMVELPLKTSDAVAISRPLGDIEMRLARLTAQLEQRDSAGARNSLAALRLVLLPQGRASELHALERLLTGFEVEAAQVELARLRARWGAIGARAAG